MEEQERSDMELLAEEMAEHVCDHLCRFPYIIRDQDEMDRICEGCKMRMFVHRILNTYNRINDFEKSQCAYLLEELARERMRHEKEAV